MALMVDLGFFIMGAVFGSFLNVCIVRFPADQSVVRPASHCPRCKAAIAWRHNIPLLSYILLRGRCASCRAPISARYFMVELLTGLIFLVFYRIYGLQPLTFAYLFMACCFVVATFVDFSHRIIPDEVSVGGMVAGLGFSLFIPEMHGAQYWNAAHPAFNHLLSLGYSLLGVIIGGGVIYLMAVLGDWLFKKESMGGGDIKLLAMIGAFLGWESAILAFFIAPFFGAVYGLVEKIRTGDTAIAYGPFLILGAVISLFWGGEIILWIQNGYGIF
jgi:leader peptidase (prepilin peptidase)/N-methyltransferase